MFSLEVTPLHLVIYVPTAVKEVLTFIFILFHFSNFFSFYKFGP